MPGADEFAEMRAELRALRSEQAATHDYLARHLGIASRVERDRALQAEAQAERNAARAYLRRRRKQALHGG